MTRLSLSKCTFDRLDARGQCANEKVNDAVWGQDAVWSVGVGSEIIPECRLKGQQQSFVSTEGHMPDFSELIKRNFVHVDSLGFQVSTADNGRDLAEVDLVSTRHHEFSRGRIELDRDVGFGSGFLVRVFLCPMISQASHSRVACGERETHDHDAGLVNKAIASRNLALDLDDLGLI